MGFLKKSSAPSELPDLAIENLPVSPKVEPLPIVQPLPVQTNVIPQAIIPQAIIPPAQVAPPVANKNKQIAGEDYLEFPHEVIPDSSISTESASSDIGKAIDERILESKRDGRLSKSGFFDKVLNDINGEIKDIGNLENWYEKKFLKQDVVSNMKGYWEDNKADIIIESFGSEYKRQINDKVSVLRELEEDWREIYFRLVKKEEEMKKEERELKETLSEFVNLCKRRKDGSETKGSKKKSA